MPFDPGSEVLRWGYGGGRGTVWCRIGAIGGQRLGYLGHQAGFGGAKNRFLHLIASHSRRAHFNTFLTLSSPLLITTPPSAVPTCSMARMELNVTECVNLMTDLIYVGVTVLFFVVSGLYVRFCEKL